MIRKPRFTALALMIVLLLLSIGFLPLIQSVPPVSQETIIVDINGNGDYTSIKEAIENANPNDIIRIKEGVYRENSTVINKKLTIFGDNQDSTIIDAEGNSSFVLDSSYVDISNLKLINPGGYSIYIKSDGGWCNISHCTIEIASFKTGIRIASSSNVVYNCDIIGNGTTGIGIDLKGANNIIKDCNIYSSSVGILTVLESHDNEIVNCNIFNNQIAIDIRLSSYDNIVTKCNIYVNDLGVYIWQSSENNHIYLNNFWKNDVNARSANSNTWDNGVKGNYWEQYIGVDTNGDGIGDTPYVISEGNADRFPLTSIIPPDEITTPAALEHITPAWDNTPSFSWDSSVYGKGVKGYYVKIDSEAETYIGDTTSWTSPHSISDGVHTFYVRAIGNDDEMGGYATLTFSIDVTFIDSDGDGWSDDDEQQYGTDPDDPDNYPLDTDNDRIADSADTDDDNDGYSDNMEISYGTDTKKSNSRPVDTDGDFVPDDSSPDGKYKGDIDDDDDGLTDAIETNLGSDPKNGLDATRIYIAGEPYHLVDVSQDGVYEILYNPDTSSTTAVERQDDNYLIDVNGDGSWDYTYNPTDGSVSAHEGQITLELTWLLAILGAVILLISILFYYTRVRRRRVKIFRKPLKVTKKPSKIYIEDGDTVQMISQTKDLLQSIQNDVTVYMDKLGQIEKHMAAASTKKEEESVTLSDEEVTSLLEEIEEPPEEETTPTMEEQPWEEIEPTVEEDPDGTENTTEETSEENEEVEPEEEAEPTMEQHPWEEMEPTAEDEPKDVESKVDAILARKHTEEDT